MNFFFKVEPDPVSGSFHIRKLLRQTLAENFLRPKSGFMSSRRSGRRESSGSLNWRRNWRVDDDLWLLNRSHHVNASDGSVDSSDLAKRNIESTRSGLRDGGLPALKHVLLLFSEQLEISDLLTKKLHFALTFFSELLLLSFLLLALALKLGGLFVPQTTSFSDLFPPILFSLTLKFLQLAFKFATSWRLWRSRCFITVSSRIKTLLTPAQTSRTDWLVPSSPGGDIPTPDRTRHVGSKIESRVGPILVRRPSEKWVRGLPQRRTRIRKRSRRSSDRRDWRWRDC